MNTLSPNDYQLIFESFPVSSLTLLPDLTVVAATDAYLESVMLKRDAILGRPLFDLFYNRDGAEASGLSNLRNSLDMVKQQAIPNTVAAQKYNIKNTGGKVEERFWTILNKPVFNAKNEIVYIIHQVEELTKFNPLKGEEIQQINKTLLSETAERKKIEKELEKNMFQLDSLHKELESFTYSVSHDLRAPLRSVDAFSKIIEEDYGEKFDDEGKRVLERVRFNAKKMGILIDDLLTFSRLGRKEMQKTSIDMGGLVQAVLAEQSKRYSSKPVIQVKDLLPAYADYGLISQVLSNLISNAFKFSSKKDNPCIEIGSYTNKFENTYFVKDNGTGFDMQYYDKLFGVFQRLHGPEEFEGSGVGLAIVNRIVSRHGGRVWAIGKPKSGATFYFTLPHAE